MMDLQDRLRTYMDSQVSSTRQTNLGAVMERGDTIRRRRRLVSVTLPAAAVLVVVMGVLFYDQGGPGERNLPEADAVAASNARLTVQPGTLDWEAKNATLGFTRQEILADGVLYVLSTAPGARFQDFPNGNIPQAVYTSADGVDWSVHPLGGAWASSIAATDGLLYAVGTAPGAEAETSALRIEISSDEGDSFSGVTLPIEGPPHPDSVSTNVAATPDGTLAVATSRTSTDPVSLLPPEVLTGAVEPVIVEDPEGGIAVFPQAAAEQAYEDCYSNQPDRCTELVESEATHFFTWKELGLESQDMVFGETLTHTAYWSARDGDFERIDYPLPQGQLLGTFSLGDRAVAVVGGAGRQQIMVSEDARTWRPVDTPPFGWVEDMGMVDGRIAMVVQNERGEPTVLHAPDLSGPWEVISLGDLIDLPRGDGSSVWLSSATVSQTGLALNVSVQQQGPEASDPIRALMDRLTGDRPATASGGRGEPEVPLEEGDLEGRPVEMHNLLLYSQDLAHWSTIPSSDLGSHIDSLMTAPDGRLIAHSSVAGENGQPVRRQYSAQP